MHGTTGPSEGSTFSTGRRTGRAPKHFPIALPHCKVKVLQLLRSTAQDSAPVVAEPCILNLHDLAPDLPQDLLPPFVCLIEVPALCCQVWPFGFGSLGFILLALQEPVEHGLGLLLITGHAALTSPGEGQATEQLQSLSAATVSLADL